MRRALLACALCVASAQGWLLWLLGMENEPSAVLDVKSADAFDSVVRFGGRNAFVKFYAPWCKHCQRLALPWERLAKQLQGRHVIAEVDCAAEGSRDLCAYYGVRQLPTLKAFSPRAPLNGSLYDGALTYEAVAAYAKEALEPACDDDRECAAVEAFGREVNAMDASAQAAALAALEAEYDASLAAEAAAVAAAEAAHAATKARVEPKMHLLRTSLTARRLQRRRLPEEREGEL